MSIEDRTDLNFDDEDLENQQECEFCGRQFRAKPHNYYKLDDIFVCNTCIKEDGECI